MMDSENILIMGHSNGDMDSIGSSLGVYRIAKTLGKEAYIVNETFGMSLYKFIGSLKEESIVEQFDINYNQIQNESKLIKFSQINI